MKLFRWLILSIMVTVIPQETKANDLVTKTLCNIGPKGEEAIAICGGIITTFLPLYIIKKLPKKFQKNFLESIFLAIIAQFFVGTLVSIVSIADWKRTNCT